MRFTYTPEAEQDSHGKFQARTVEWFEPRFPGWARIAFLVIGSGVCWTAVLFFAFALAALHTGAL